MIHEKNLKQKILWHCPFRGKHQRTEECTDVTSQNFTKIFSHPFLKHFHRNNSIYKITTPLLRSEVGILQMDAAQLFRFDPIPAKAKKLGLLSIHKFSLGRILFWNFATYFLQKRRQTKTPFLLERTKENKRKHSRMTACVVVFIIKELEGSFLTLLFLSRPILVIFTVIVYCFFETKIASIPGIIIKRPLSLKLSKLAFYDQ